MRYSIYQLIPQREPFLFVDELVSAEEQICTTKYQVKHSDIFIDKGKLLEAGVIEHMAQSASVLAGFKALESGIENPPLGMIGEIKSFSIHRLPALEDTLESRVSFGLSVGNITVASVETFVSGNLIAEAIFKISID